MEVEGGMVEVVGGGACLVRYKEDRGRRKRNHLGICIMPNEALERLMACLLASIA